MTVQAETVPAASRWEDFIDVIFSPGELFDRRANEGWVRPFVILCAVAIVLYYLLLPVTGGMWEAAVRQNAPPDANRAQLSQMATIMKWAGGVMIPFGFIFMIAVSAIAIKLVSALLEPGSSWRQAFVIATFALYVAVPQSVITAIPVFFKARSGADLSMTDASFGLLRFTGPDVDPVVRTLLGRTDLFAIWSAVLIAIGLMRVVRMPRNKAILTAAIVWALAAVPGLAGAALFGR